MTCALKNPAAKIVVTDGFTQYLTLGADGQPSKNPYQQAWSLIDAGFINVLQRECIQNNDIRAVHQADLAGAVMCVGYSFGGSSNEIISGNWQDFEGIVVRVLAVPDDMRGQFGNWKRAPKAKRDICIQVTPTLAVPVSEPILDAPWVDFVDMESPNVAQPQKDAFWNFIVANPVVNIKCDNIAKQVWMPDLPGKIWNHTNMMNDARVIALVTRIATTFIE